MKKKIIILRKKVNKNVSIYLLFFLYSGNKRSAKKTLVNLRSRKQTFTIMNKELNFAKGEILYSTQFP